MSKIVPETNKFFFYFLHYSLYFTFLTILLITINIFTLILYIKDVDYENISNLLQ